MDRHWVESGAFARAESNLIQNLQFFSGLYFPHALSSCGDGFCSSCQDKNLVKSWNH
jgi:hypothetical protein